MAATNYTPIQLYHSTTASASPTAGNLVNGELAINILDGKLYYKDNGGVVQVIATKGTGTIGGSTTQVQYNLSGALAGSSNFTFDGTTATINTLNLTNALGAAYGGTAQSTYAQGDLLYASAANTLAKLPIGISTYILTSNGSIPGWSIPSSVVIGTATNLAGGAAGSVPYQSGAGTTTFLSIGTANQVVTSTGSAPQWSSALTLTGLSNSGLTTLDKTVTVGNTSFNGAAVFAPATPAKVYLGTGTVTDVTSAIAATNAAGAIVALGITPIAATNANVTYTNASTLYIAGAPSAGTNITITNPYALYVAAGNAYFGASVSATTLDLTNIEVTNIKAKDGTASMTLADSTGIITLSATAGTANGVAYLNGSRALTTGSALTFDGTALAPDGTGRTLGTTALRWGTVYATALADGTDQLVGSGGTQARFGYGPSWTSQAFAIGGSEQMRLTSTGLGIGTTSPLARLSVQLPTTSPAGYTAAANSGITLDCGTSTNGVINLVGGGDLGIFHSNSSNAYDVGIGFGNNANRHLTFVTANAERMRLDSSGNLGLGVTPSAWSSLTGGAFQNGGNGALWSQGTDELYVSQNVFFNGASRYVETRAASAYQQSSGNHRWYTAPSGTAGNAITFTQAMTLDASGNLGLGTTNPAYKLDINTTANSFFTGIQVRNISNGSSAVASIALGQDTNLTSSAIFVTSSTNTGYGGANSFNIYQGLNAPMAFFTNGTERARITSGGYFKASNNGTYTGGSTSQAHEFNQSVDNNALIVFGTNATLSTSGIVFLEAARNTTNNSFYAFSYYNSGAAAYKFRVADSGDVTNTNGTYGTISDAKMKTDIVDAGSQWSDIKALRFRKFKMKDDPSGLVQLGVVAQEVEQTSPGLVDEHADRDAEGNDLGTTTKSVKTSVLLMKAAVALQEAMARIETLEAKVAALKGA